MLVKRSNLLLCLVVGAFFTISTFYYSANHTNPSYTYTKFSNSHYTKVVLEIKKTRGLPTTFILVLSSIAGEDAYGPKRHFSDYLSTLKTLYENKSYQVSLGLLVKNQAEFDVISKILDEKTNEVDFHRITLVIAPTIEAQNMPSDDERHADKFQRERRRSIARARNFLISSALQDEEYTLFVDADIKKFKNPRELLSTFIDAKLDIIVPRIDVGSAVDYDRNSWRGERTKPNEDQLRKLDANDWDHWDYVPQDVTKNMFHFSSYLEDKPTYEQNHDNLSYTVELDSVGGAVLFAKSIIYKQGVIFPTSYIVGTTWERLEGYDGIETEGLCYLAKPLGYKCWGMPNMIAFHSER
ncbi:glycosyltransferase family 62 protein [Suhomyces tanzawaensis NRRL Y-17324]|uniref:Glycosyltransferase family 62 protein n=1 Tax=Suhomyces tanzawaensis NRRL Y-17324 TaxID=984487 RepID=A0A1E4SCU4_9ASCO|nr:glycosyltransferase family 62 protein [Suhomyces tanzawaensis NRRL Y-17324]ODV77329.1 glycosyltransferase family 62 protein [Suhomyces tanzawaensis NRRL Y-17324]